MAKYWQSIWVRGLVALVLAVVAELLVTLSHFTFVWGGGYLGDAGVLDFAGGAVVHVGGLAQLLVVAVIWGVAEIVAWRTGRVPPLGSYLIFVLVFTIVAAMLSGVYAFAALVPAWLSAVAYAVWRSKRVRPKAPDVF